MIIKFRTLLFYFAMALVMAFYFIFVCGPCYLTNPGFKIRYKVATSFSYCFVYLMKWLCNINFEVENMEELPKNTPFIALPNHQSHWENFFMQLILPIHSWIIKKELLDIPVFGLGLRVVQPVAVDRTQGISVRQILHKGSEVLQNGYSLLMFPEGGRVPVGKNVLLKASGVKLAMDNKVPIAIIVHNSGLIWPKGFWFKKEGVIKVRLVRVISPEEIAAFTDVRKLNEYVNEIMNEHKEILLKETS